MRVKKFTAPTMVKAMRQVKDELGEDAVIVHTREYRRPILGLFGRPYVEVTAGAGLACDKPVSQPPEPPETSPFLHPSSVALQKEDRVELSGTATKTGIASPELKALARSVLVKHGKAPEIQTEEEIRQETLDASVVLDRRLEALEGQLTHLTGLVERIAGETPEKVSSTDSDPWKVHLRSQGVEESLVDDIFRAIPAPVSRVALREELIRRLPVTGPITTDDKEHGPTVVMLIGPTGVGKTTTLAKIAPAFTHSLVCEQKRVVFMTADLFRIAAVEQLQKYSEILRVPLEVVYAPEEATEVIRRHQDAELILVDTGGTGQRNETQISNLAAIARACKPIEVYLVVSATTKSADLADIIDRFQELEPQRLLITKLDESTAFGNILNAVVGSQLPVSYLTTGQMVPEDIEVASSERLADMILGEGKSQASGLKPQASGLKPQASGLKPQASSLKPQASGLKPQASSLKPQASSLKPQASSLKPQASSLKPQVLSVSEEATNSVSTAGGADHA